jgi:hypothetical protein
MGCPTEGSASYWNTTKDLNYKANAVGRHKRLHTFHPLICMKRNDSSTFSVGRLCYGSVTNSVYLVLNVMTVHK